MNNDYEFFVFSKCPIYQRKTFMMGPQSHMKNIIWNPNFISKHIFLNTFSEKHSIQFIYFLDMFDKLLDSKNRAFHFWNYLFQGTQKQEHIYCTLKKPMLQQWLQRIKGTITSSWNMNCCSCATIGVVYLMDIFHQEQFLYRFQDQTTHYKWLLLKRISFQF